MAVSILGTGMVTPVGFSAPASCAAMRVGIDGFQETRFKYDGDWLRAGVVPWPDDVTGKRKLVAMVSHAIQECLSLHPGSREDTALLLCLPETARRGRPDLDEGVWSEIWKQLATPERLSRTGKVLQNGCMSGVEAIGVAEQIFSHDIARYCIVAGVDSYLSGAALDVYHAQRRLVTSKNSDGFWPGEAAAAVLLTRLDTSGRTFECLGVGWGKEPATLDSGLPLRADGLMDAYRAALRSSGCGFEHLDYRVTDIAGEQWAFKEAALALARTMRVRKEAFDLWHPGDCVGRVGAATVPLVLGVALRAAERGYAPGPGVLCHFSEDTGVRAAAVLRQGNRMARAPRPFPDGRA